MSTENDKKSSQPEIIKPALFVSPEIKSLRRILIYGLIGVVAFLLVLPVMWLYVTWYGGPDVEEAFIPERHHDAQRAEGPSENEKLMILESLKSDVEAPSEEDQRALLGGLHSQSGTSLTPEEKKQILKNLQ